MRNKVNIQETNITPFSYYYIMRVNQNWEFDFVKWWDPQSFNWTYSGFLARYCSKYFEIWWDPQSFNWRSCAALTRHCRRHFTTWWDPEKFDWNTKAVKLLIKNYSAFVNTWWDPLRFPWKTHAGYLIKKLPDQFETWWNEEKFPWGATHCNMPVEHMLVKYCSKHFPAWYYSERFHLSEPICDLLKAECGDFKDLWAKDYFLYRLSK